MAYEKSFMEATQVCQSMVSADQISSENMSVQSIMFAIDTWGELGDGSNRIKHVHVWLIVHLHVFVVLTIVIPKLPGYFYNFYRKI